MNNLLSAIDKQRLLRVLSSVAASYTRRELDRRAYDQLMASPFGQTLKQLSNTNKYALEFVFYAATAIAAERVGQPGPLGQFLKEVLTDAPSEIARRMINGAAPAGFNDRDVADILNGLSASDFDQLAATRLPPPDGGRQPPPASEPQPMGSAPGGAGIGSDLGVAVRDAADYVEELRAKFRRDTKGQ